MDYRYHILTTVQFLHTYFADTRYRGFTIEPDAETMHQFKRLSLLFKPAADGFSLLYETAPGLERSRADVLKEGLTFGFIIRNNDPDFMSYTDQLPADISSTILFLRNNVATPAGLLHAGNYFSEGETLQNQLPDEANPHNRAFFVKPFAWLTITLHDALEDTLVAQFRGRETLWRYILTSEHLQDLAEPAVIHKDTKDAFRGPLRIALPDGTQRIAFESNRRIPLCSKPEKQFQLVEHFQPGSARYRIVMGILPNPDLRAISAVKDPEGRDAAIFSEIFI